MTAEVQEYPRHTFGKQAESLALEKMLRLGYELVQRNYRTPFGEIDLICRKRNQLVFIEVRARTRQTFMHPLESIDYRKQQRLRRSAEYFLAKKGFRELDVRFDVICATGSADSGSTPQLEHFENALTDGP